MSVEQRLAAVESELIEVKMKMASIEIHAQHLPEIHHLVEGMKVLMVLLKALVYAAGILAAIGFFFKTGVWKTPTH
jgi:hypothetical protein